MIAQCVVIQTGQRFFYVVLAEIVCIFLIFYTESFDSFSVDFNASVYSPSKLILLQDK